jgi:hypothetical protein
MGKMSKYVRMAMNADMRGGMRNEARYGYDSRYEDGYESTYEPRYEMESRRGQRRNSRGRFMRGEMEDEGDGMNTIGFYTGGDEIRAPYDMEAGHKGRAEMEWRGDEMQKGHAKSRVGTKLNRDLAIEWVRKMKNADGSTGAHWRLEQVKQIMRDRGIKKDEAELYAIMNALYSDYCVVFMDHGVNESPDFYLDLACAWLDDEDAVENKAGAYYECVVKH